MIGKTTNVGEEGDCVRWRFIYICNKRLMFCPLGFSSLGLIIVPKTLL